MTSFIEYQLEDGTTVLVQAGNQQAPSGLTKVNRDRVGNLINSVNQKFDDAFAGVRKSALVLRKQLEELRADEVEVTFGLTAAGEFGNFAIGQLGAEANYQVRLKWNNSQEQKQ